MIFSTSQDSLVHDDCFREYVSGFLLFYRLFTFIFNYSNIEMTEVFNLELRDDPELDEELTDEEFYSAESQHQVSKGDKFVVKLAVLSLVFFHFVLKYISFTYQSTNGESKIVLKYVIFLLDVKRIKFHCEFS